MKASVSTVPLKKPESLVEAAFRNEAAKLRDAVPGLLTTLPPREALRAWMSRFMDYAGAKLGIADALRTFIATGGKPDGHSRDLILEAVSALRQAGVDAGTLRADINATDMLAMLTGIALASGRPEQRDQAERLLDLALDGLSTRRP